MFVYFHFSVITLAKVIERLLEQGNSGGGLLRDCFSSLMEASIQLKEAQEEMEDEESNGETEDIDEDDDNEDDEVV